MLTVVMVSVTAPARQKIRNYNSRFDHFQIPMGTEKHHTKKEKARHLESGRERVREREREQKRRERKRKSKRERKRKSTSERERTKSQTVRRRQREKRRKGERK